MLNTLIESRSQRKRNTTGTVTAITAHALIIAGAAYATATAATTPDKPPAGLLKIYSPPEATKAAPKRPATHTETLGSVKLPRFSVDVSPDLPSIDIPLGDPSARTASDFPVSSLAASSLPGGQAVERSVYDAAEVESEVTVVSGFRPQYPAALRASAIEGRVVAQFVVTVDGKTDPASIRIISSTNDAFAESVRQALLKSKFRAARIGTKSVPQLVEQLFVFKLDR